MKAFRDNFTTFFYLFPKFTLSSTLTCTFYDNLYLYNVLQNIFIPTIIICTYSHRKVKTWGQKYGLFVYLHVYIHVYILFSYFWY